MLSLRTDYGCIELLSCDCCFVFSKFIRSAPPFIVLHKSNVKLLLNLLDSALIIYKNIIRSSVNKRILYHKIIERDSRENTIVRLVVVTENRTKALFLEKSTILSSVRPIRFFFSSNDNLQEIQNLINHLDGIV